MTQQISCEEVTRKLDAAFDDELPEDERDGVFAHIAECAGCAARAREFRKIRRAVRDGFPQQAASPALRDSVRMQIRETARISAPARQLRTPWRRHWSMQHVVAVAG